jgi:type I restriction enzyme S subunit
MTEQTSTIPKGWKMTTLGEVLEIKNGKSRPDDGTQYPVYGGNGILGYADTYNIEEKIIIVGRVGAYCGSVFLEKEKFWLSDNALGVLAKKESNIYFLYYLLKKINLNTQAIGGAQPLLTQGVINQIEALVPEQEEEQRAIAAVLSSLDDKIELLREQNKTLEATAQAIFKEWFVDFNFPCATGKMIDSELGKIPEGWRVGKLGDEVKIVYGKNLPTESLTKNGYAVFGANGQIGFYDKFIYEKPQVLVSCRGEASGKVNISLPESFVTNNSLVLEITDDSDLNFCFLKFFSLNNDYTNFVTGSAQPQITIDSLKNCALLLPEKEVINLYNATVEPLDKKQLLNFFQIQTLSTLRDILLPKLMKGQVRVKGFKD